jgi:F-type H+-transporting ATPase subunit epsilon
MLRLEIVTPEKKVIDTEADSVTVPTASGDAGILPSHAPLVSALRPGILTYTNRGTSERIAIGGGFLEVSNDKVSILADSADLAADINTDAARLQREEAERAIAAASTQPIEETENLRDQLETANARLQLAAGK